MVLLIMQFVFIHIDDMVGKGLSTWVILKLLFYISASLVPMALPISILLASIMTFGTLGEHSELIAIKSSGISLMQAMKPVIIFMLLLSYMTFLFSNYVIPYSNFRWRNLMYNIRVKKPTLSLTAGTFNTDVDGLSIKIDKKIEGTGEIEGILIYRHKRYLGNVKCITAKKGTMKFQAETNQLVMILLDGYSYEEVTEGQVKDRYEAFVKTRFYKQVVHFDVSSLNNIDINQNRFNDNKTMLKIEQLETRLNGKRNDESTLEKDFTKRLSRRVFPDTIALKADISSVDSASKAQNLVGLISEYRSDATVIDIVSHAKQNVINAESLLKEQLKQSKYYRKEITQYILEIHRKYALSFACIVLFFVGAPLGAIVRKGGFGLPVIFSICIFIVYHIIFMLGYRMANSLAMDPILARWLPSLVLLPFGLLLTYQATGESKLLVLESYGLLFQRMGSCLKKIKIWVLKKRFT